MGKCSICGSHAYTISDNVSVCLHCIRKNSQQALRITQQVHAQSRAVFGLPTKPPKETNGTTCKICANQCIIGAGKCGFCGLVWNLDGRLVCYGGTKEKGVLEWYYDSLPTNCVNWWFCPGCTGVGYPQYAYKPAAEYGYANLAVFYGACSFDCLFCQNWHYRSLSVKHKPLLSAKDLSMKVNARISCICFFGGDPSPQMPHSLEVARLALEIAENENRIIRICWETNGYMNSKLAEMAAEYALKSGGNIKFDIKAWNESLNFALCGVSNKPTLENFSIIGQRYYSKRKELPVLAASTLLVSGYVDSEEVENIAKFISEIDAEIPYTLLALYPCYVMDDLPKTSKKQALECKKAAEKYLSRVRIGNVHLLT